MKALGSKIKRPVLVFFGNLIRKSDKMAQALKFGPMEATIAEGLVMELNKALESIFGLTVLDMLENGSRMKCRERERLTGQTVETSRANSKME